jgi:transcriptional regulator with XRE-family HTH domain
MELETIVEVLQGLIWAHGRHTKDGWKELAGDANLCYSTIRNLAAGETKSPHLVTTLKILKATGVSLPMFLESAGGSPTALNPDEMMRLAVQTRRAAHVEHPKKKRRGK